MNKNQHLLDLMNIENWVESSDNLVFVQLFYDDEYQSQYPCSILDAMRVTHAHLVAKALPVHLNLYPGRWKLIIPKHVWMEARWEIKRVFDSYDFGSRELVSHLDAVGWKYDPTAPECFTKCCNVGNADKIASDLSDWTGFTVVFHDNEDDPHWRVCLENDDVRRRFAHALEQYKQARCRIERAMVNGALPLTHDQYERAQSIIDALFVKTSKSNDRILILFSSDVTTREIVSVLDAAGL